MNIEKLRNSAINKREELKLRGKNLDKINYIIDLLKDDMCFFKISINISIPILLYLGISESRVKDVYFELISSKNFDTGYEVRKGIDM